MSTEAMLPDAFRDLEPLASDGWCLATERDRVRRRHASAPETLRAFYDRFAPRLEAVVAHLDAGELDALGERDQNLMYLLLSMAEVSFAVEKFGADESSYRGLDAGRFVPAHELPDGGLPVPDEYR